jgi:GxxExxY protein
MDITQKYINELTYKIIGCAIEVHKALGPGLYETVYEKCMAKELTLQGLKCDSQKKIPLKYKGVILNEDLCCDILVEGLIVVEIVAAEEIMPEHEAAIRTYMKMLEKPKGIILNFHCTNIFKEGQRTFVNELFAMLPKE